VKLHVARILVGALVLVSFALLSPASAQAPAPAAAVAHACRPSKLDYLVLASFADSSNMLAMSTYRASKAAGAQEKSLPTAVAEESESVD
jgi:hypothetical protein